MDGEQRRHTEMNKAAQAAERKIRELQFQVSIDALYHSQYKQTTQSDENKKQHQRLNDLVDKLQQKLKVSKRQVEEAVGFLLPMSHRTSIIKLQEELASTNLQKYRQLQAALESAEERADTAEQNLSKIRAKSRSAVSVAPSGPSGTGLAVCSCPTLQVNKHTPSAALSVAHHRAQHVAFALRLNDPIEMHIGRIVI